MPVSHNVIVIGLFVATDLVVIPLIIRTIVNGSWGELQNAFPARPVAGGAVLREFQSLRIGTANFGGCVHIAVDEACLHLLPAMFIRWFGAGPVSIPWESLSEVRRTSRGRFAEAVAGRKRLTAPAWALELAEPCRESA